jgi:Flp pilus assembly protein TadG
MTAKRQFLELARRLAGDRSGAAAVELALVLPMLAGILLPMADLGIGAYDKMRVQDAAAAGAQYALEHGFTSSAITTAVQDATSLGSNVTLSPAAVQACYCTNSGAMAPPPSDTTAPSPPCTSGACSDGSTPGTYVTVSTTYSYAPIAAFSVPGLTIPSSITLTGAAVVRIN